MPPRVIEKRKPQVDVRKAAEERARAKEGERTREGKPAEAPGTLARDLRRPGAQSTFAPNAELAAAARAPEVAALGAMSAFTLEVLSAVDIAAGASPGMQKQLERTRLQNDVFVASAVVGAARRQGRELTALEQGLVNRAIENVQAGVDLPALYATVGNFGNRPYQTQISLADVGEGHLGVTLKHPELLKGLIVHHEYIDRETLDVAPYRAVSPAMNAVVRLHAGGDAPVTVYYGRPNFQSSVRGEAVAKTSNIAEAYVTDPVTPVHDLAASASAFFENGTADVKVAMDGLRASQAVDFMQRVSAQVERKPDQFLSSAFNLNRPITDDRPATLAKNGGQPRVISDPAEISRVAIELAKEGGWEKVTLDSASDRVPSVPLMELLGPTNLIHFVHAAHSAGLETYISGGMRDNHFADAAYSAVDGVGVGFSMHFREPGSGVVGPIDPAKIKSTMAVRDAAERSPRGVGAKLLAQLDHQFADQNGDLAPKVATLREELFRAIVAASQSPDAVAALGPLIKRGEALGFLKEPGAAVQEAATGGVP